MLVVLQSLSHTPSRLCSIMSTSMYACIPSFSCRTYSVLPNDQLSYTESNLSDDLIFADIHL